MILVTVCKYRSCSHNVRHTQRRTRSESTYFLSMWVTMTPIYRYWSPYTRRKYKVCFRPMSTSRYAESLSTSKEKSDTDIEIEAEGDDVPDGSFNSSCSKIVIGFPLRPLFSQNDSGCTLPACIP